MKITFVLAGTGNSFSGGLRVIYEHANRLKEKGHEINIAIPTYPSYTPYKFKSLRNIAVGSSKNIRRGNKVGWFPLEARLSEYFRSLQKLQSSLK